MKQPPAKSLNPVRNKERIKMPRQRMPEQPACERATRFTEVKLRVLTGTRASGSLALPGVRQANLHGHMSGGRQGEGIRAFDRGGRLPGSGGEDP